jgi:hypothetical protein
MMTRKDNMMAIYNHQSHDHIGSMWDMVQVGGDAESFENGPLDCEEGADGFGLIWRRTKSGNGGGTPAPNQNLIPDITEWRDVVHFPEVDKYDWEGQAKMQMTGIDRNEKVIDYCCWNGPFLRLVNMMGMVEGLMAFAIDPEACEEFLNAYTDYRISTLPYIKKYFDPDVVTLFDDFAHERGLFLSPDTYDEIIKPQHKRWTEAVRSYGFIPDMHVCGKPEAVVPGFVEEGMEGWQIVQQENDIVGLQKEIADKLALIGCWDLQAKWITPGVRPTEEELRAKVREAIDKYGPGGNVAILCMILNPEVDFDESAKIMHDEVLKYGTGYYCK